MNTWSLALNQKWFVVARADRVRTKPIATVLLGRPIVLARLDGKHIVAFEDRCPHRHVPFSSGKVTNGTLQCRYHGWRFDSNGELVEIPGAPRDVCLPNVRARPLAVVEVGGLVWATLQGNVEGGIPVPIRELPDERRRFLWQASWQANAVDILENILDPLHTHFVHRGLIRISSIRHETVASCSTTPDGFTVDYQGNARQSGLIYRLFESPRMFERAHFFNPGSVQLDYGYKNGSRVRISIHVSPQSAGKSTVFGTVHINDRWAPKWAVRLFLWPLIRRVANQDRDILALQTENVKPFMDRKEAVTQFDIVRRRILRAWETDQADCAEEQNTKIHLML